MKTEKLEIKRDFKLSGQIGEAGQPGKLTYVAVIHEIELGLSKGYKETEIVEEIIAGISPHSSEKLHFYIARPLLRKVAQITSSLLPGKDLRRAVPRFSCHMSTT